MSKKTENEEIKPSDIILENTEANVESDDSDMPQPDIMDYDKAAKGDRTATLKPKWLFMKLFQQCTDRMPYATILQNAKGDKIKLMDLVHFVEARADSGMQVDDMDRVISFLAPCRKEHVRDLMEVIEATDSEGKPSLQSSLWEIL